MLQMKKKSIGILHSVSGEWILCQKHAFIKKSTIFTQSLWNLVKMNNSWVLSCEYLILAKFRNDCEKISDFLVKAYFWVSLNWVEHVCKLHEFLKNRAWLRALCLVKLRKMDQFILRCIVLLTFRLNSDWSIHTTQELEFRLT